MHIFYSIWVTSSLVPFYLWPPCSFQFLYEKEPTWYGQDELKLCCLCFLVVSYARSWIFGSLISEGYGYCGICIYCQQSHYVRGWVGKVIEWKRRGKIWLKFYWLGNPKLVSIFMSQKRCMWLCVVFTFSVFQKSRFFHLYWYQTCLDRSCIILWVLFSCCSS